ncbi:MAG: hypothetical protein H7A01_11040 [Hahellaceae bacterium]|nr:hypothetical protein [Hahellaceae bacterium]
MIYRMGVDYQNLGVGTSFSVERPKPFKMDSMLGPNEFMDYFEEITPEDCTHCKLYKAPLLAEWRMRVPLQVTIVDGDMPDMLVLMGHIYVSEQAKAIIEQHDPFGHQFWPVEVRDTKGTYITDKRFFHMNMRRYVTIENLNKPPMDTDFTMTSHSDATYLPTIQHDVDVRANIETLPLWQHFSPPSTIGSALYINETMYKALQAGGITGIKEFTQFRGKQGEMVSHV